MSVHISSLVWKDQSTTGNARLLLLALADMANDEGVCWPSVGTLRERLNLGTDRAVQQLLKGLEEQGFLTREMRSGHSTLYRVNVTGGESPFTPERTFTPNHRSPHPRTAIHPTPEQPFTRGVNGDSPRTIIEPSMNHQGTVTGANESSDGYEDTLGNTLSEPLPAPAPRQPSKAAIHDQKCQDLLAAFRHARHGRPLSETVPYTFRREGMQLAAAMVKDGTTPEQLINATKTALASYARPDMVTFQAVGRNIETLLGQSSRPVPSQEQRSYQMPKRGYTREEMAAMFPEIAALDAWVAEAGRTAH